MQTDLKVLILLWMDFVVLEEMQFSLRPQDYEVLVLFIAAQLAIIVFHFLVIAVDIDPQKIQKARHNSAIYGVADKIEYIVGDFISLAGTLRADAVFLSPPWGGPTYLKQQIYELDEALQPIPFTQLMKCAKQISNNVGIFLPRNSNTHTVTHIHYQ